MLGLDFMERVENFISNRNWVNIKAGISGNNRDLCDREISCVPTYRSVLNTQKYFNFTLSFTTTLIENGVWLSFGGENYVQRHREVAFYYGPYIRDREEYFLFYCENGWTTVGESYSHWTSPFKLETWMIILAICAGVVLVDSKFQIMVSYKL